MPSSTENATGSRAVLNVHPRIHAKLADPLLPLWVTEGARKADSAVSQGLCCLNVTGVWGWRGRNDQDGLTALADWELIALKERKVYLAFDSDLSEKPEVNLALRRLKKFLEGRGAEVLVVYLPAGEGGAKVGLDDFLATGKKVDDLLAHASTELRGASKEDAEDPGHPYRLHSDGLYLLRSQRMGGDEFEVEIRLTNWMARIVSNVGHDDGAERRVLFEIEAATATGELRRFSVPAARFASLAWAIENLGAEAITYPTSCGPLHVVCGIQTLSGKVPMRTVYAHIGWRVVDGAPLYLHADGAIGAKGVVDGIEVDLPSSLSGYKLPSPPEAEALRAAVRNALRILEVAPQPITAALLGGVARAPLGPADFSLHLSGPTGEGKSELAALVQRFWGAGMHAKNLPASWSSTGNSLESIAFSAKDAILVVDDFAPGGSLNDVQRMHKEADRLLRAQGNRSGRNRLSGDGSHRPVRAPRGLTISTGEDVPRGASLRARVLVLELGPGEVNWDRLTECQRDAAAGVYAQCLAGYVSYLAAHPEPP